MVRKTLIFFVLFLTLGVVALAEGSPETHGGGMNFAVGDYVSFGRYEQDNDSSNGPEDIEWLVLDTLGENALLLSRFPLEQIAYKDSDDGTNWMRSGIREWLNTEFFHTAFTDEERKSIHTTLVDNSIRQGEDENSKPGGADTKDNVFLLSYAEVKKYLPSTWQRVGPMTKSIKGKHSFFVFKFEQYYVGWWLRTIGTSQNRALTVNVEGDYGGSGIETHSISTAARPAVWVSMGALKPIGTTEIPSLAETTSSLEEAATALVRSRTLNEQTALLYEMAALYEKEIKDAEWDVGLNSIYAMADFEDLIPDLGSAKKGKLSSKLSRNKKIIALYSHEDQFCLLGDFYVRLPEKKRARSLEEADGILYLKYYLERRTDYSGFAYNRVYDVYWIDRESGKIQKIYSKYSTPPVNGFGTLYGEKIPLQTIWKGIRSAFK